MKKSNLPEIICFFIFCTAVIALSFFHEPWFDEFQAWGISKDSIFNILFVIPHLEGHPPLWHLILKCFSFFNVNCELGIKIPNLLFMFGAVWLLIFKSPFPRIIKLALPFTYFLFYQYSIISRPYSIFCFAIFLAAYFYKERNEHPFKFISALALLCLSCAYGMVISTGIIIAWFIEIIRTKKIIEFFKDKRFFAMFIIFLLCAGLALIIIPDKDIFVYNGLIQQLPFFKRFLLVFFILPSESLFLNLLSDYSLENALIKNSLIFSAGVLCGLIVNLLFFLIYKKQKKLLLFFIPYLMILITFFNVYLNQHHIGILTVFYIFALWCISIEPENISHIKLKKLLILLGAIVIIVQINWSITASINDIKYPYSVSRNLAMFIKKHNLQNYKIMENWYEDILYYRNKYTGERIYGEPFIPKSQQEYFINNYEEIKNINFYQQHIAAVINPYFNKNIVYSSNINNPEKEYIIFKKMSQAEIQTFKQKLKEKGLPDIILNQARIEEIFDLNLLKSADYILIKKFYFYKIWKNHYSKYYNEFYMKRDLYNKLFKQEVRNEER